MKKWVSFAAMAAAMCIGLTAAHAQSGSVSKAVGGYSFEDAAKEAEGTKNFHSADGHLTFAIVTHTAGNGFFDPVYVGATVAGNMIGAKILLHIGRLILVPRTLDHQPALPFHFVEGFFHFVQVEPGIVLEPYAVVIRAMNLDDVFPSQGLQFFTDIAPVFQRIGKIEITFYGG